MRYQVHPTPEGARLLLEGAITEGIEATLLALRKALKGKVVAIDCRGIDHVSSRGIQPWTSFLDAVPEGTALVFENCSAVFVYNANAIGALLGRGRIDSFVVELGCAKCKSHVQRIFRASDVRAAGGYGEVPCDRCGRPLVPEADTATYLAFLDE